MKSFIGVLLLLVLLIPVWPKEKPDTEISPQMLAEIERSLIMDGHTRLARNALAQSEASKVSVNWDKVIAVDKHFSLKLKYCKISDQESTGRCWMFAGLNILRPEAAKNLGIEEIEFSQNYLFFYDKLEKANMFLEGIIRSREKPLSDRLLEFLLKEPVPDGGQWVGMVELIRKYGVVPKEVMPETNSSANSRAVNRALGLKLRQYALALRRESGAANLPAIKLRALKDVYKILAVHFGVPAKSFGWRYEDKDKKVSPLKTYTPIQFYQEVVKVNLDDYYALFAIPNRPVDKLYEIDFDKAVFDRPNLTFVNCSIETLKELAKKSLLDNQPVWFGCDVGQESFGDKGVMIPEIYDYQSLYGLDFQLSRRDLFDTYADFPNHAMVFTGIDIVGDQVRKWLVQNSWGEKFGNEGFFYMIDQWFDYYVQMIIVHKKYIPEKVLGLFQTKPEVLPPWDPMYRPVE